MYFLFFFYNHQSKFSIATRNNKVFEYLRVNDISKCISFFKNIELACKTCSNSGLTKMTSSYNNGMKTRKIKRHAIRHTCKILKQVIRIQSAIIHSSCLKSKKRRNVEVRLKSLKFDWNWTWKMAWIWTRIMFGNWIK